MSKHDDEAEVFFDSAGGLYTESRLNSTHGTSPVRVTMGERGMLRLVIYLSGGEVAARLEPETARDLADALNTAAEESDRAVLGAEEE